jgi:hypothetical protein
MEVNDMKYKIRKLEMLWEKDEWNKQEILIPVQWRVLRRCDGRSQEGCRCILPAIFKLEAFYDGKLQFTKFLCDQHLAKWCDDMEEEERRGNVSLLWSFKVRRIASPRTIRRLIKQALILHGL